MQTREMNCECAVCPRIPVIVSLTDEECNQLDSDFPTIYVVASACQPNVNAGDKLMRQGATFALYAIAEGF